MIACENFHTEKFLWSHGLIKFAVVHLFGGSCGGMVLTEDEKALYKDAFQIFDKNRDGAITYKELGTVMRCLGLSPTEAQLLDIIDAEDPHHSNHLDFLQFCKIMESRKPHDTVNEDEIRDAFKVFDKDGKGITVPEFRHILANLGEKISDEDVETLIQHADVTHDLIHYEQLVKLLSEK
jgi:calmodulin